MFFASLISLLVAVLMLLLLFDDLSNRKTSPSRMDYVTDAMVLIGFLCVLVVSGHSLIASFH